MLSIVLGLFALFVVLLALFTPSQEDSNRLPDSHSTGKYGARAAYTLLQKSGYSIERWEQPLSELAAHASPQTVLILADPSTYEPEERTAIRTILSKGGRVLATDFTGGMLLPANGVKESDQVSFGACEAQPEGLQPLAAPGSIWILPRSGWQVTDPLMRTAYTCRDQPVVVEYPVGKGRAVWWASSSPLENDSIARSQNLELLLNSIGPAAGHQVYWDESLHGAIHTQWEFVSGPVWPLFWSGFLGMALLVILSFSRRSGPIRTLPQAPRTTPIEFLEALGSLYRSTGANATAVQIAFERFRSKAIRLTGLTNKKDSDIDADQLSAALIRRFGPIAQAIQPDLIAAQEAIQNDNLKSRQALAIVQSLRRHEETLRSATSASKGHLLPERKLSS